MVIKAVVFDLFGTLVKCGSPEDHIIKVFGLRQDFYEVEKISNTIDEPDDEKYAKKLLGKLGISTSKGNIGKMLKIFEAERSLLELFPDSIPTLEKLKGSGFKIGLISNSLPFLMGKFSEPKFLNLFDRFDCLILSEKVGVVKPDPKIFSICLDKLGIKPADALMVGDSLRNDVKGAEAFGMKALLLDRLSKQNFPSKILSLKEILNFVNNGRA